MKYKERKYRFRKFRLTHLRQWDGKATNTATTVTDGLAGNIPVGLNPIQDLVDSLIMTGSDIQLDGIDIITFRVNLIPPVETFWIEVLANFCLVIHRSWKGKNGLSRRCAWSKCWCTSSKENEASNNWLSHCQNRWRRYPATFCVIYCCLRVDSWNSKAETRDHLVFFFQNRSWYRWVPPTLRNNDDIEFQLQLCVGRVCVWCVSSMLETCQFHIPMFKRQPLHSSNLRPYFLFQPSSSINHFLSFYASVTTYWHCTVAATIERWDWAKALLASTLWDPAKQILMQRY